MSLSTYMTEYTFDRQQQEKSKDILQKDLASQKAKHPEEKGHIDANQDKPSQTGQHGILE